MIEAVTKVRSRRRVCCHNWRANLWRTVSAIAHTPAFRFWCELMIMAMLFFSLTTSGDRSEGQLCGDCRTYHAI